MIYPVVLAGLQGGTLPATSDVIPSHFCADGCIESRFQSVLQSLDHPMFAAPTVVACEAHRFVAMQQMEAACMAGDLIIEPCRSKSAALLAALALRFQDEPEALLLILPAHHAGTEGEAFRRAVENALQSAFRGDLVLLADTQPTGYGQLRALSRMQSRQPVQALFSAGAASSVEDPRSYSNSGVYLVRAGSLLAAFKRFAPRLLQSTKRAVCDMRAGAGFLRLAPQAYGRITADSFEAVILSRMETVSAICAEAGPDASVVGCRDPQLPERIWARVPPQGMAQKHAA